MPRTRSAAQLKRARLRAMMRSELQITKLIDEGTLTGADLLAALKEQRKLRISILSLERHGLGAGRPAEDAPKRPTLEQEFASRWQPTSLASDEKPMSQRPLHELLGTLKPTTTPRPTEDESHE